MALSASRAWAVPGAAPSSFGQMVGLSILGHAVVLAMFVLFADEVHRRAADDERTVMTISLGGAPGPRSGGMTPLAGRPVQQVVPEAPPKAEPVRPPAPRPPAMVLPEKAAVKPAPKTVPAKPAPESSPRAEPTRGTALQSGNAVAQTGAQGLSFGLSTGGGGGTGGEIDLGNFCCPDYLSTMLDLIQRNWNSRQQVAGDAAVKFTIRRDGTVTDVELARSSGYAVLDLAAQRAIAMTRLPPLPRAYTNPQLTVTLTFQYQH
jgi:TonB family protein